MLLLTNVRQVKKAKSEPVHSFEGSVSDVVSVWIPISKFCVFFRNKTTDYIAKRPPYTLSNC